MHQLGPLFGLFSLDDNILRVGDIVMDDGAPESEFQTGRAAPGINCRLARVAYWSQALNG